MTKTGSTANHCAKLLRTFDAIISVLHDQEYQALISHCQAIKLEAGQSLTAEQLQGCAFVLVAQYSLSLTSCDPDQQNGAAVYYHAGDIFHQPTLNSHALHQAMCICAGEEGAELLLISQQSNLQLTQFQPGTVVALMEACAQCLDDKISHASSESAILMQQHKKA